MTATMQLNKKSWTDSTKEKLQQVNWVKVTHVTFWTFLGGFWLLFSMAYFAMWGWYVLGGILFLGLALSHFGMAAFGFNY